MHYDGTIIRPPSEADSILLQVMVGCAHNRCTFCGAYKGQRCRVKPASIVQADIVFAARHCQGQRRLFLCDGDVMALPQKRLLALLGEIRDRLPWVTRVGLYASARSLRGKHLADLMQLHEAGLGIVYMGLETGSDKILDRVAKGVTAETAIRMGRKVKAAGIRLSVTVILGLAGGADAEQPARLTGEALSRMDPDYVGALTLMLVPGTPLYRDWRQGAFELPGPHCMLVELRHLLAATRLSRGLFHANHASNYLPLRVRLPRDKPKALTLIDAALDGEVVLRPDTLRGL